MNNSQPTMTMQEFYQKVIDDFKKKLFDKFNQKQKDFDSQMIDQIANVDIHISIESKDKDVKTITSIRKGIRNKAQKFSRARHVNKINNT